MDYLTQQFIAFAKKTREILESLRKDIEKISTSIDAASAQNEADKQHSTSHPPVILGELRRPQSEIDQEEACETRKEARAGRNESRDSVRLWFEAVGLCVGLTLAAANVLLATSKSVDIAKIAASAAQSQGEATRTSIEATTKQFQLDQRAWVAMEQIQWETVNNQKSLRITAFIQNHGKTPAKNLEFFGHKLFDTAPMSVVLHDDFTHGPLHSKGSLTPSTTPSPVRGAYDLSDREVQELMTGKKWIYLYGIITYKDVFSGTPLYYTRFCVRLEPHGIKNFTDTLLCEQYNDAD